MCLMKPLEGDNMTPNEYAKELEITLMGDSPDGKLSGGARINTLINILKAKEVKINLVSYLAYSNKFKIEHKNVDDLLSSTTIHFPSHWHRFLKAPLLLLFNFVYSWKSTKTSHLILSSGGSMLLQMPMIAVSKLRHKPFIFDYLDIEVEGIPESIYGYFMKNVTVVFAISHYLVDKAKSYGCKNVVYVPAFVDTNLFQRNTKARERLRANWRVNYDAIIIGYAGALAYTEGIPILLQSFKNLSEKYPKLRLFILGTEQVIGQGDEIFGLVKKLNLEGKVTFIPPVPHAEVPNFLSACDILCSPKVDCEINRAANPIKVVEYLSMGIPTICSSIGEVSLIIQDMVNGFLVKPGDVKDLEERLEWIILNPERSKEIGEKGRNIAIEKYSSKALQDTIGQAISEIVDRKKRNKRGD
ncbi:MAG: D-inositol-3-phosphate glycosyltransferase [Candidatus Argoarchaeum ethanivorans]|uniref:D-inositol-3-phosphate glycosyltransferase n=1 Tax=Candidatus Argoarchaeum ethanivorans TaxID=2608793 RepID=A0A811T7M3_9EURY|nr:MAG: D-inositol-3-phosphate glycosyltransferase [Candidatus Argoarchaeum ethanivorans]